MSDRRDAGIAQAPARDPGAISFFDATAQQYLAAYDANSLSGYVLRTLNAGCEFWGVDGSPRMIAAGRRPVRRLRPSALRSCRRHGTPIRG